MQHFITEKGTIEMGTPLTADQHQVHESLVSILHEQICKNKYHSIYNPNECLLTANYLIVNFAIVKLAQPEPVKESEADEIAPKPEIELIPDPLPAVELESQTVPDDNIPW